GGLGKNRPPPPPGGAFFRRVFFPPLSACDLPAASAQFRPAAGQRVRAGRRKIRVLQPVGDAVGGSIVSRGHADRYPQRRRILQQRVVFVERLLGPRGLRTSPAD